MGHMTGAPSAFVVGITKTAGRKKGAGGRKIGLSGS